MIIDGQKIIPSINFCKSATAASKVSNVLASIFINKDTRVYKLEKLKSFHWNSIYPFPRPSQSTIDGSSTSTSNDRVPLSCSRPRRPKKQQPYLSFMPSTLLPSGKGNLLKDNYDERKNIARETYTIYPSK